MRVQPAALTLLALVASPIAASAGDPTATEPVAKIPPQSLTNQLPALLQRLGINLIAKAQAAECIEEGETCTSTEQCCPGLECAGGPPATCAPED